MVFGTIGVEALPLWHKGEKHGPRRKAREREVSNTPKLRSAILGRLRIPTKRKRSLVGSMISSGRCGQFLNFSERNPEALRAVSMIPGSSDASCLCRTGSKLTFQSSRHQGVTDTTI